MSTKERLIGRHGVDWKKHVDIIMLDIDGVLNSLDYVYSDRRPKDEVLTGFDPLALETLNRLIEALDVYIVISSSWRKIHSVEYINNRMTALGFKYPERVIGRTGNSYRAIEGWMHNARGLECAAWVEHHMPGARAVMIDDETYDHWEFPIVKTDSQHGLLGHHIAEVAEALTSDLPSVKGYLIDGEETRALGEFLWE